MLLSLQRTIPGMGGLSQTHANCYRYQLSVATTKSAIVASGGCTSFSNDDKPVPCAIVEVYSSETSQWHTADPLPVPCSIMTSVTIADTWYQLGGNGADNKKTQTVLYAPLATLILKATSPTHLSANHMSVWKTLPGHPNEVVCCSKHKW